MGLPSGTKLGPYEIQSPLGAGGMGEVYRALDTRLEREVAVKVLPANLSSDPSLRQRLEREAKAISKLSHPHICTLHDIGHHDGVDFLVMELVEGETLERRLTRGPLPTAETLRIASEIADALAQAHKLGIVHRDLKPANVMLTKTGAKLMDFGLAKQASLVGDLPLMTAEQSKLTMQGSIVGTFQYMAPEQLEGKDADARVDIFALGELIYEMATGKPAFSGKSQASLIAAILSTEPPSMAAHQPMTPPALERVVSKCLAKDPDARWQSASDLASELRWIAEGGSRAGQEIRPPTPFDRGSRLPWILAAVSLVGMLVIGFAWWQSHPKRAPAMYFHAAVPVPANDLALSPDGRVLAMIAYSNQMNNYALWTYEVGTQRSNPLNGTQGASYPFWSPDGKTIAFFSEGKLKRVDATGGPVQVVCDAISGRGGAWNRDGTILFSPSVLSGLVRVSSSGGTPTPVTQLDLSRFETSHRWATFLPDGRHFLYLAANFTGRLGYNAIYLGSLDSPERRLLLNTSANASYVEPGYLVYMKEGTLVAQPFDWKHGTLSGEPRVLSDEVLYFPQVDRAVYAVSNADVLIAQTGKGASLSQLTWFDRSGKQIGTVGKLASYDNVRLAPDGQRVAADQIDSDGRNVDIWVHEMAHDTMTRLTFDPALDHAPIWSPDGKQIIFSSNRAADFKLYLKNADGSGPEEEVVHVGSQMLNIWDWARDGKYILFRKEGELWYCLLKNCVATPLLQVKWTVANAQFSPNGRWFAYTSNESGTAEIYVSPFPNANSKWQVSNSGGQEPRWRQDGKELFYLGGDGKMMSVTVTADATFAAGTPAALFQTHRRQPISNEDVFSYDVSADGQRFLIATKVDDANAAPLSVMLNWASAMEK
jgi:eukaryotic-like serine/threonine-protein kinase